MELSLREFDGAAGLEFGRPLWEGFTPKPQSEQVQSLSEDVQGLAAQYEREQKQLAGQVETLTENMVQFVLRDDISPVVFEVLSREFDRD